MYTVTLAKTVLSTPSWLVATPRARGEVGLSWKYKPDPHRAGYNVYRNGVKVNAEPIPNTSFVDKGLRNGETYRYVVRAIGNPGGAESPPSNEATAKATSDSSMFGVCLTINVGEVLDTRMGDLTGDGYIDFLFSKWDDYKKAYNYRGELLWEIYTGDHGPLHYGWSAEYTPTHIWDIDNDGLNEVVCQYWQGGTWHVAVLEGATGRVKALAPLPARCYKLAIANFRGLPKAQDFAINLGEDEGRDGAIAFGWVAGGLSELWRYPTYVSAHYPKPADIDGDGHDEYVMGHKVLDHNGVVIHDWPWQSGHADSIMVSDFGLGGGKLILIAEEGWGYLFMYDPATRSVLWRIETEGTLSWHEIDIGNVRQDYPGYEIEVTRDDNGDINVPVLLISNDGRIIWKKRTITNTEECKLILWRGGNTLEVRGQKGIFDGYGNKIGDFRGGMWLGDVIGDYREEYFTFSPEGIFVVFTNPDFNPDSKPSIWESDPERVMEEYVNYSFY